MADSDRKSRLNRDTVAHSSTIFDFLKRKQQITLENTANKTLHQHSSTKQKKEVDFDQNLPHTRDLSKYKTHDLTNKYARTARQQSVTPHRLQFQDLPKASDHIQPHIIISNPPEQVNRRGKSFLSMISPAKNRASSALMERQEQKDNHNRYQNKSGVKGNKCDNYVRRNLTKSIGVVKEKISQLSQNINLIKDKSHSLAVLLNPIFSYLTEGNHPVSRQVGELRNKFKSFEVLVDGVSMQTCDQQLQNFHRTLEQHLQTQQGDIRKQALRSKDEEISQLKNQKQILIQKLQSQLKKAIKDNDLLVRRIEKIENSKGQIQQAVSQREVNYVQQLERIKIQYESTIEQLRSTNEDLVAKIKSSTQHIKVMEKEHKNQKMAKQSLENKFREQLQQITEAKDAYLLNEIMVLKAEFNADLSRVNQLHKLKEAELLFKIEKREEQVNQKNFQNGCNKQIEAKILEEANSIKQQNLQLKTQADCIITDMYRMNEQLYQHWIALKDIKTLSTRMGSFAQYRKIYQDL